MPPPSYPSCWPHGLYSLLSFLVTIPSIVLSALKRVLGEIILFFAILLLDTAFFLLRLAGILLLPLDAVNVVQPAGSRDLASQEGEEGSQLGDTSPAMARGATTEENGTEEDENEDGAAARKRKDGISEAIPRPRPESEAVKMRAEYDASPSAARSLLVNIHPAILDAEVVALYSDQEDEITDAEGRDVIDGPEPKPEAELLRTDLDDGLNSHRAQSLMLGKQPIILNEEIVTSSSTSEEQTSQDIPSPHRDTAAIIQLTRPGAPRSLFPTSSAATDPSNHPTTTNRTSSQPTSREQNRSRDLSEDLRVMNAIMKKQLEESNARLNKA